jgi:Cu-processing system permease protein
MLKVLNIVVADILKNRILLIYTLLLACLSWAAFILEDNYSKGLLTLLDIVLLTVPMVSILFSTIYVYNFNQFLELLLSQPVKRRTVWASLYAGISLCLLLSFLIGAGIPLMIFQFNTSGMVMLMMGCFVSLVFVSLAFLATMLTRDKARGVGIAVMLWLFYALLFDGILLFMLFQFSEYPVENAMMLLTFLSPIDLARIMILLHLDISAMLGYTGALFRDFFGSQTGIMLTFFALSLWIWIPFRFSAKRFKRENL